MHTPPGGNSPGPGPGSLSVKAVRPDNNRKNGRKNGFYPPTVEDVERAERLREVLEDLQEINRMVPIIVEGRRDERALRRLGMLGEIITFHRGKSVYDFCEDIALRYRRVVLLMDWDTVGEKLMRQVGTDLKGHWEEFALVRNMLKVLCQKDTKDVEGIPRLLSNLEGSAEPGR
jgi:5S rRNA maturation endonuclease (ribonuclease M5)